MQLDWLNQYGPVGGGQFSASGNSSKTMLASLNPSKVLGADEFGGHGVYFDEIVELSLTDEDPAPRRIGHHMVTIISPVTPGRPNPGSVRMEPRCSTNHTSLVKCPTKASTCFLRILASEPVSKSGMIFLGGVVPDPDPDPDPDPEPTNCTTPADWTIVDIGNPALAGSTCEDSTGALQVNASGWDIWDNSDAFHFVYQGIVRRWRDPCESYRIVQYT